MNNPNKPFKRHFRIYFKNNHPAFIIDEEGNMYVFHRMTHSKTSGGRNNLPFENPLLGGGEQIFIVKKEQRDKKNKFSAFELELKPDVDLSYIDIKKVGATQDDVEQSQPHTKTLSDTGSHHTNCRSRYESSNHIKPKVARYSKEKKRKRFFKRKQKRKYHKIKKH